MNISVEKEDWIELIRALKDVEKNLATLDGGPDAADRFKAAHQGLQGFHTTASMLGLSEAEHAGLELERYLKERVEPALDAESISVFGFALNALLDGLKGAESGNEFSSREIMDILGAASPEDSADNGSQPDSALSSSAVLESEDSSDSDLMDRIMEAPSPEEGRKAPDLSKLQGIVAGLGGELAFDGSPGKPGGGFVLRFNAVPAVVEQLETLLSPGHPINMFADRLSKDDNRLQSILDCIKEFLEALADRNVARAEEILSTLAEQKHQAGMYNEIGSMARELHNALRNFMDTMDPQLREIVEDKIPDYGNRLEHILELTEKAATTTLDHVEILQKRNNRDHGELDKLMELLGSLRSIGEQAEKRLVDGKQVLDNLLDSSAKTRDDLITILTAQDYQDLTGQVILKIIKLLKDLEAKLVNMIRTFGVKVDGSRKKTQSQQESELYGPAHKSKEALHSQDEVDDLLAEFGF